jgi:hypothetical protein
MPYESASGSCFANIRLLLPKLVHTLDAKRLASLVGLELLPKDNVGRVVVAEHLAKQQLAPGTAVVVGHVEALDIQRLVVREVGEQLDLRRRLPCTPCNAEHEGALVFLRLDRPVERRQHHIEREMPALVVEAVHGAALRVLASIRSPATVHMTGPWQIGSQIKKPCMNSYKSVRRRFPFPSMMSKAKSR